LKRCPETGHMRDPDDATLSCVAACRVLGATPVDQRAVLDRQPHLFCNWPLCGTFATAGGALGKFGVGLKGTLGNVVTRRSSPGRGAAIQREFSSALSQPNREKIKAQRRLQPNRRAGGRRHTGGMLPAWRCAAAFGLDSARGGGSNVPFRPNLRLSHRSHITAQGSEAVIRPYQSGSITRLAVRDSPVSANPLALRNHRTR